MISYSQNLEDVILFRALKHITQGFYIDVGANDPKIDSVTLAFYERGWRGINIEPLESHYIELQMHRPRDINLRLAAGVQKSQGSIWECDVRGWATVDPKVIAHHELNGLRGSYQQIQIVPLTIICNAHVNGEIHFLKIDVEGFEKSVLDGFALDQYKPWIIVIESTKPNSTIENYAEWEPILIKADYMFAYADGLNRFYVSPLHPELMPNLRYPPNVFDSYSRSSEILLQVQTSELKTQHSIQAIKADELAAEKLVLQNVEANLRSDLNALMLSLVIAQADTEKAKGRTAEAEVRIAQALAREEIAVANSSLNLETIQKSQAVIDKMKVEFELASLRLVQSDAALGNLREENSRSREHVAVLTQTFEVTNRSLIQAHEKINSIYASTSWRLTGPMRRIVRLLINVNPLERFTTDAIKTSAVSALAISRSDNHASPRNEQKVNIEKLIADIRSEIGVSNSEREFTYSSALTTPAQNLRLQRWRSLWFKMPQNTRSWVRRLPFFFRFYRYIVFKK